VATVVRTASTADARGIADVHVAGWRWAYRGLIPDAFIDALRVEDRERFWTGALATPGDREVLVAEEDGTLVGFVAIGPTEDEDALPGTGEVVALYVLPEVAGSGVGRTLFAAAIDRLVATPYARGSLWVLADNERARRFYEAAGWSWDGTIGTHRFDCAERPVVRYIGDLIGR
jgi:ribosomal protein S18 acetylase RimI-like enzyme